MWGGKAGFGLLRKILFVFTVRGCLVREKKAYIHSSSSSSRLVHEKGLGGETVAADPFLEGFSGEEREREREHFSPFPFLKFPSSFDGLVPFSEDGDGWRRKGRRRRTV